ncbi:hypothetical protein N6H14_14875 [Paenibacillus sp. CC-CFT747]|nr:hypothetical protein N6H14_14875 [Paenibacillus sp. CC-CFT747]
MDTQTAFGLDLGGATTQNSSLVRADRINNNILLTIYDKHAFNEKHSNKQLDTNIENEISLIKEMMYRASVYIDIPLDTQDLPYNFYSFQKRSFYGKQNKEQ